MGNMASLAESVRVPMRKLVRAFWAWRNKAGILLLRMKGCKVAWSAVIHPSAAIEPSGGSIEIGPRTHIDRGAILRAMGGHIRIGADCSVNAYSFLSGSGGIDVADHVMMGSHASIYASNHVFADLSVSMDTQGLDLKGIRIERDVWVGTGVRILDGVQVGAGSILAAGAVVTKSIEPYSINGGVPARQIGSRIPAHAAKL